MPTGQFLTLVFRNRGREKNRSDSWWIVYTKTTFSEAMPTHIFQLTGRSQEGMVVGRAREIITTGSDVCLLSCERLLLMWVFEVTFDWGILCSGRCSGQPRPLAATPGFPDVTLKV